MRRTQRTGRISLHVLKMRPRIFRSTMNKYRLSAMDTGSFEAAVLVSPFDGARGREYLGCASYVEMARFT
jgi:hypothetical protein